MSEFDLVLGGNVTPETIALPGAVVTDCARCPAQIAYSNRCPEYLEKICINCVAKAVVENQNLRVLLPSGAGDFLTFTPPPTRKVIR